MFVFWRDYRAISTVRAPAEYSCETCGARAAACVDSIGRATSTAFYDAFGGSAERARERAALAAQASVREVLEHVPCPACGAYPRSIAQRSGSYLDLLGRRHRRGLLVAGTAAGVVLALGAVPALRDLRESWALPVTILATAVAVFALAYAIVGAPPARPLAPWGAVHFWWGRPDGTVGWTPPPAVALPPPPAPSYRHLIGVGVGTASALVAVVGVVWWAVSFVPVFFAATGNAPIVVDGTDVTERAERLGTTDGDVRKLRLRTDRTYAVTVNDATYTLSTRDASGWVVAPAEPNTGFCFVRIQMAHGDDLVPPKLERLQPKGDVLLLDRVDDVYFAPLPREVERGAWKSALRRVRCDELPEADDERDGG